MLWSTRVDMDENINERMSIRESRVLVKMTTNMQAFLFFLSQFGRSNFRIEKVPWKFPLFPSYLDMNENIDERMLSSGKDEKLCVRFLSAWKFEFHSIRPVPLMFEIWQEILPELNFILKES